MLIKGSMQLDRMWNFMLYCTKSYQFTLKFTNNINTSQVFSSDSHFWPASDLHKDVLM